jgi:hypothetical protein
MGDNFQGPFRYLPAEPGMESLYQAQNRSMAQPQRAGYIPSEPGMMSLFPDPQTRQAALQRLIEMALSGSSIR